MITATIGVFLALFGGMAFLGLMIWFISRRNRGNSPKNFIESPNSTNYANQHNQDGFYNETDDDVDFVDNSYYTDETAETKEQTAYEGTAIVENYESTTSENSYSPPAESSYSDSSSYDSGGSYDSGSSYDSGGSSDSGSSFSSD